MLKDRSESRFIGVKNLKSAHRIDILRCAQNDTELFDRALVLQRDIAVFGLKNRVYHTDNRVYEPRKYLSRAVVLRHMRYSSFEFRH